MPSKKPKVQGVVDPELHQLFINWKNQLNFPSEGSALNHLLKVFFTGDNQVITGLNITSDNQVITNITQELETIKEQLKNLANNVDITNDNRDNLAKSKMMELELEIRKQQQQHLALQSQINELLYKQSLMVVELSNNSDNLNITNDNLIIQPELNAEVLVKNTHAHQSDNSDNSDIIHSDVDDNLQAHSDVNSNNSFDSDNEDKSLINVQASNSSDNLNINSDNYTIKPEHLGDHSRKNCSSYHGDNSDNGASIEDNNNKIITLPTGEKSDNLDNSNSTTTEQDQSKAVPTITTVEAPQTKTYSSALIIIKEEVLKKKKPLHVVADILNASGYPTKSGKVMWTKQTVGMAARQLRYRDNK